MGKGSAALANKQAEASVLSVVHARAQRNGIIHIQQQNAVL